MTELNGERILKLISGGESESFEFEKVFRVKTRKGY
jgi:hypothetical protein